MRQLVNDLLQFSSIDTKAKEFNPVDMNEVLSIVRENMHFSILEMDAEVHSEPLPTVIADQAQMVQLVTNLLSNAIKFHGTDRQGSGYRPRKVTLDGPSRLGTMV